MECDTCGIETLEDLELDVWTCNECAELLDIAWQTIAIARRVGAPKYGPSSWRDVSIQEHLEHASKHVYAERKLPGILVKYDHEDHLAHAICRLMMVRALQNGS